LRKRPVRVGVSVLPAGRSWWGSGRGVGSVEGGAADTNGTRTQVRWGVKEYFQGEVGRFERHLPSTPRHRFCGGVARRRRRPRECLAACGPPQNERLGVLAEAAVTETLGLNSQIRPGADIPLKRWPAGARTTKRALEWVSIPVISSRNHCQLEWNGGSERQKGIVPTPLAVSSVASFGNPSPLKSRVEWSFRMS